MHQSSEISGRPERVDSQIEEVDIKQIVDLAQEEQQGQTTFIHTKQAAPTPPACCRGEYNPGCH
jgi:hypothetical protein